MANKKNKSKKSKKKPVSKGTKNQAATKKDIQSPDGRVRWNALPEDEPEEASESIKDDEEEESHDTRNGIRSDGRLLRYKSPASQSREYSSLFRDQTPQGYGGQRKYFYNGHYTLRGGAPRSRSRLSSNRCSSCGNGADSPRRRQRRRERSRSPNMLDSPGTASVQRGRSVRRGRSRTRAEPSFTGAIITLSVGTSDSGERQTFMVHKSFLCHYSPKFRELYSGHEDQKWPLEIYEEPNVAALMIHWIYHQNFNNMAMNINARDILLCWLLADYLKMPPLQNDLMHLYINGECFKPTLCFSLFHEIWRKTTKMSPIRSILVEECVCFLRPDLLEQYRDVIPVSMMEEMLEIFGAHPKAEINKSSWGQQRWYYHKTQPSLDFYLLEREAAASGSEQ